MRASCRLRLVPVAGVLDTSIRRSHRGPRELNAMAVDADRCSLIASWEPGQVDRAANHDGLLPPGDFVLH